MGNNEVVSPEIRFWELVNKTDGCWLWSGTTNLDGYGRFKITTNKLVGAHRFSYSLANGLIPSGKCVCHTCDNPRCVNPSHLFLGSHSDNMQDMYRKRRHNNGKSPQCHPRRSYHAKDLCQECYMRRWRKSK